MRYLLSKLVPVPMQSVYCASEDHRTVTCVRWWQWRGRSFYHRTVPLFIGRATLLALLCLLLLPALALAAGTTLVPVPQVWVLLLGALTPLVSYVLNHYGAWISEPIKAFVLAAVAAITAALYTAIETSVFGWNNATLQLVLAAIVAAFAAHHLLWKPSGISAKLGAGTNAAHAAHHAHRRSSV
jgi:hypothetical protein